MKIGIFTNHNKDGKLTFSQEIVSIIEKNGAEAILFTDDNKSGVTIDFLFQNSDVLVVLGGDGTILRLSKIAARLNLPILGINLGRVGFLSEVENNDLENAFKKLISGRYTIEERAMLNVRYKDKSFLALNETMLGRFSQKIVNTELYIDDKFFYSYYADGLIVSTPTGSTAYSLSSGGPILCPGVDGMVVTAVCPHSLYNRPIVVAGFQKIKLRVAKNSPKSVLMVDGEYKVELEQNDEVYVEKSDICAKFIRLSEYNFFSRLVGKLNKWSLRAEDNE
ncbi:MAG: NAD(+)/NADH kinase [Clostridia bacterium]|nr:NAD(+)/NADH kinase [Clostridia bacterium]